MLRCENNFWKRTKIDIYQKSEKMCIKDKDYFDGENKEQALRDVILKWIEYELNLCKLLFNTVKT